MAKIIVWQCGHCGTVYKEEGIANECCNGDEEKSYQCTYCNALYSKPFKKCMECKK